MILLDTNVRIYAFDPNSPSYDWARETIAESVASEGAVINAVSLAEICVGDADPRIVGERVRSWGVEILAVPAPVAEACAEAYIRYRKRRMSQSGGPISDVPLPDFFTGAHAKILNWDLATADTGRVDTYSPPSRSRHPTGQTISTCRGEVRAH